MGVIRVEKEVPSAVAPSRLFKALNDTHNFLPKIAPQTIKSIDILQGDGGAGTIKLLNFADGGNYKQTKQRIDALDEDNLTMKYTTYEGDGILKMTDKSVYDVKIMDSGNGGSICKFVAEVHANDDKLVNEGHAKESEEKGSELFKLVEAYLLGNPNLYA
ncbi:hypothetical protein CICLE_v10006105mg [Citrus x clementina]|uniref:Bet v I/Major latex protein domain-containing protein n=2 Tax=Citrus TaxID=2706 RepID=V4U0E4_CITCL|nr:major allergen Pru ar 1 [Citrus x clementina]ESR32704.1 hypothetical protein CICLE_v10006105mg [Citrus x clementina]GAY31848.1 hypothetical protein CUMW_272470 [Citrus unshiu]